MKRYPDWEKRLDQFIASRENTPFSRGGHDCVLFACDCVVEMTGVDPAKWGRGRYKTMRGAASRIKEKGKNLKDAFTNVMEKELGCERVNPNKAQRGDLVVVERGGGVALGVVDLDGRYVVLADDGVDVGLARVPMSIVTRAWRI